ncbi:MAG: nucleotidyltransferase family protein [Gammaproteobacteria bacterium]|nr:nucleotidyltransferase family protein [Gammaproteobacteria bacterium]
MGEPLAGIAGLVLAAGAASRFAGPKQLARLGGEPLVVRAARLALGCCGAGVVVVTGAYGDEVEAVLAGLPVVTARNPDWAAGMGGSLARGVAELPAAASACLVLLGDQPAITSADLDRLVAAWRRAPGAAAAASFADALGAPAIFPAALWRELAMLQGDRGARALLAALPQVTAVAMPHAALDIDTPEDLARVPPP